MRQIMSTAKGQVKDTVEESSRYKDWAIWCLSGTLLSFSAFFHLLFDGAAQLLIFGGQISLLLSGCLAAFMTSQGGRARVFLVQSFREIKKISWPTRKETVVATLVVVFIVVLVSLLIWLIDSIYLLLISGILK